MEIKIIPVENKELVICYDTVFDIDGDLDKEVKLYLYYFLGIY